MIEFENAAAEIIGHEFTDGLAINLNLPQAPGGIPQLNLEFVPCIFRVAFVFDLTDSGTAGTGE
ncbi:MAG: hypothetical protein ACKPHU_03060, partial [Planctomycetaceae bacterium]